MPLDLFSLNTIYNGLKESGVAESFAGAVNEAVVEPVKEKATALAESAKETIMSNLMPGISRIVNKAIPTALAASATKQYMGGQGSFVEFLQPAYLQASFQRLEADKHVYIGHMCHKVLTLSTLSGFTMCEQVQLDIPTATVEDLEIITRYLETGVILE